LPNWGPLHENSEGYRNLPVADGVELVFIKVDTSAPLARYQPSFMSTVLANLDAKAEGVFYFDPAVLVLAQWNFFEKWLNFGLAVCEGSTSRIHANHPLVRHWRDSVAVFDTMSWNPPSVYLSNSLVGVRREWDSFLHLWHKLLNTRQVNPAIEETPENIYNPNADALTIATGFSLVPLSWVGNDGLGHARGEWLTIYASSKPWTRRVLFELLTHGRRLDTADHMYWSLAAGPIPVEKAARIKRQQWALRLAAALGRFYNDG
jgi:hypothetical protein